MADPWTEQHRPRTLDQVHGNPQAIAAMRRWAESWKGGPPKERALLLAGPPGTGKTSAALALGAEQGWEIIELNASDARSGAAIQRVAGMGSIHQTFSSDGAYHDVRKGERKLIILDEADNLFERARDAQTDAGQDLSDRGGKRAIVDTVLKTQQPVVLIVNDPYQLMKGSGAALRRLCVTVPFRRLPGPSIRKVLRGLAQAHNVAVAEDVLEGVAQRAQGDLRSAINDLEALTAGRDRVDSLGELDMSGRDRGQGAFEVVAAILKGTDALRAVQAARELDEPPEFLLAWLDENVPHEYRHPEDLARAYEHLSRADVFLGRTFRRQAFSLWGYATEVMAGGVASAKTERYGTPPRYQFPGWIRKMGSSKGARGMREALAGKLGIRFHMGRRAIVRDVLPFLRQAMPRNQRLAVNVAMECDLDEDEIRFLLEDVAPKAFVDDVVSRVERRRDEGPSAGQEEFDEEEAGRARDAPPVNETVAGSRHRRTSLGDF